MKRPRTKLVAAGLPAGSGAHTWRIPSALVAFLSLSVLFLLATAVVAVVPARRLPARVAASIDGRREGLVFCALCAVGAGLMVALLIALATS